MMKVNEGIKKIVAGWSDIDSVDGTKYEFRFEAYIIKDDLALIIEPEYSSVTLSRVELQPDGIYLPVGGSFELDIDVPTLMRIQSAKNELELLTAALAV